jgi:hypothetical protein
MPLTSRYNAPGKIFKHLQSLGQFELVSEFSHKLLLLQKGLNLAVCLKLKNSIIKIIKNNAKRKSIPNLTCFFFMKILEKKSLNICSLLSDWSKIK